MLGMLLQRFEFVDPFGLPAQDQGDPDHQARRPEDHRSGCARAARPERAPSPSPPPSNGNRPSRTRAPPPAPRRGTQHPADGAVRIQPRHRRGHRDQDRPGRRGPRLRRHARRPRRPHRRPAARGRAGRRLRLVQRQAAGQRRAVLPLAHRPGHPADAAPGLRYTVFGCGNIDWAATYQAVPTLDRPQLEAHGAQRVHAARRGRRPRRLRRPVPDLVRRSVDDLAGQPRPCPTEAQHGRPAPSRGCSLSMVNRQTTNPVVVSYRAPPSTLMVNRELQIGGERRALDPPRRAPAARRRGPTRPATTSACCRATTST